MFYVAAYNSIFYFDVHFTNARFRVQKMKYISWQLMCAMAFGFLLGRISIDKLSKKNTETHIVSTESKKQEVSTQAETQKVVAMRQQMNYTEKSYSKNGILLHEISYGQNNGAITDEYAQTRSRTQNVQISDSYVDNSTDETYQSNWIIGIYHPVSLKFEPSTMKVMLSYRLLGNLYVSGLSDVKFSKIEFGIQIQL